MQSHLFLDEFLPQADARELLFFFIRWGEHDRNELRQLPDAELQHTLVSEGYPWHDTIKQLRESPHRAIPYFENLSSGILFQVEISPGLELKHEIIIDGVSLGQSDVPAGGLLRLDYVAQFAAACRSRDAAIKLNDSDEYFSMLTRGFASIDSFLTMRAHVYNHDKSDKDKLLDGINGRYIATDVKLKKWLPKMTKFQPNFERSPAWTKYLRLKKVRDDAAVHPKIGSAPKNLEDLASGINDFREAIGSTMVLMHQIFGMTIPSEAIRAMKYPAVRVRKPTYY